MPYGGDPAQPADFASSINICFSAIKSVESAGRDVIIRADIHLRAEVSHSDILTTYTAFERITLWEY